MRKQNGLWGWAWPGQKEYDRQRDRAQNAIDAQIGLFRVTVFMAVLVAAMLASNAASN